MFLERDVGGWRGGSEVKGTDCSYRGPEFNSQQPHGGPQPSVMRPGAFLAPARCMLNKQLPWPSISSSSRGPEFNSQQPHGDSQPSVMRSGALFWPADIHTKYCIHNK